MEQSAEDAGFTVAAAMAPGEPEPLVEDGSASNVPSRHLVLSTERENAGVGLSIEVATLCQVLPADKTIRLDQRLAEEDIMPLFDGSGWAGTRVWEAAVILTDEVIDRYGPALAGGCRVVELGCGLGLPGMACAALGANAVLTDVEEVLEILTRNVASNFGGGAGTGSCKAAALRWEPEAARALADDAGGVFDLVLCCDCVFEPLYGESWKALVDCLNVLCSGPATTALISVTQRNHSGIDRFLARAAEQLQVELLCSVPSEAAVGAPAVDVYAMRRPGPVLGGAPD